MQILYYILRWEVDIGVIVFAYLGVAACTSPCPRSAYSCPVSEVGVARRLIVLIVICISSWDCLPAPLFVNICRTVTVDACAVAVRIIVHVSVLVFVCLSVSFNAYASQCQRSMLC